VDRRTDQLLQEALRKTFQVGTIIAVAHRLDTVIDCDCILVLGQGRVLEFGSPAELLRRSPSNNDDGISTGVGSFASMVQDTGETTARELRQRAFQKEAETNATTKTAAAVEWLSNDWWVATLVEVDSISHRTTKDRKHPHCLLFAYIYITREKIQPNKVQL
jgi:ABC-type multidrug transport system ATPase subunit